MVSLLGKGRTNSSRGAAFQAFLTVEARQMAICDVLCRRIQSEYASSWLIHQFNKSNDHGSFCFQNESCESLRFKSD